MNDEFIENIKEEIRKLYRESENKILSYEEIKLLEEEGRSNVINLWQSWGMWGY